MRRVPASLLLALWSLGLALPFLQAQPSAIPACCRRDGKHHCAMSPGGDGFRTIASNCPYRNLGAVISPSTALKESPSGLNIGSQRQPRVRLAHSPIRQHTGDTTQKRGPPRA